MSQPSRLDVLRQDALAEYRNSFGIDAEDVSDEEIAELALADGIELPYQTNEEFWREYEDDHDDNRPNSGVTESFGQWASESLKNFGLDFGDDNVEFIPAVEYPVDNETVFSREFLLSLFQPIDFGTEDTE